MYKTQEIDQGYGSMTSLYPNVKPLENFQAKIFFLQKVLAQFKKVKSIYIAFRYKCHIQQQESNSVGTIKCSSNGKAGLFINLWKKHYSVLSFLISSTVKDFLNWQSTFWHHCFSCLLSALYGMEIDLIQAHSKISALINPFTPVSATNTLMPDNFTCQSGTPWK